MDKVIRQLQNKVESLRAELKKAEQALSLVREVLGVSGEEDPSPVNATKAIAKPAGAVTGSKRAYRKREDAARIIQDVGMSMTNYVTCILAAYPGEIWAAAELWDEVSHLFTAKPQMFNAIVAAKAKGLVKTHEQGHYSSTKAGDKLRDAMLRDGILKVDGSEGEPASKKKVIDELTGLGRALLSLDTKVEKPAKSGKPAKSKPGGKAKTGGVKGVKSGEPFRRDSIEVARSLTPPKVSDEETIKERSIETVDLSDTVKHLRAMLAARPHEEWRYTAIVRESGIDPKLLSPALKQLVLIGEVRRGENGGAYVYVGSSHRGTNGMAHEMRS